MQDRLRDPFDFRGSHRCFQAGHARVTTAGDGRDATRDDAIIEEASHSDSFSTLPTSELVSRSRFDKTRMIVTHQVQDHRIVLERFDNA